MTLDRKNKLLILVFLLMLYLSYTLAISKTINYYKQYESKKTVIDSDALSPELLFKLKQKEKQLDTYLSAYKVSDSKSFQNDLLKQLNQYTSNYNLKIIDFKQPHLVVKNGVAVTSYIFSLEGSFNGCLLLVNRLEKNTSIGIIRHIDFVKKRDYKTNRDYLVTNIILERKK